MQKISIRIVAISFFMFVVPVTASAQMWSAAQQAVLKVVVDSRDAIVAEDVSWSDNFVHPDAVVWGNENPMPRTRDAVKKWDRYQFESSTTLAHEISPAAIVVSSNTAIAHYYYSLGTENPQGVRRTVHGRCTDILVRQGDAWKFLGWNCGDMEDDD